MEGKLLPVNAFSLDIYVKKGVDKPVSQGLSYNNIWIACPLFE